MPLLLGEFDSKDLMAALDDIQTTLTIEVPANLLVAGTNTITAETHVNYRSTADVTFWLTADLTAVK